MLTGIGLHDLSQYARHDHPAAERRFAFRGHVSVLAVAESSPAHAAGIRPGDSLLAINGEALPPADDKAMSTERSESATLMLDRAANRGSLTLSLLRDGRHFDAIVHPFTGCRPRYLVMSKGSSNAWTDGRNIAVTHDLLSIAARDDELAAVLAHELAHVIGDRDLALPLRSANRRAREEAADRLSVRLMIAAGYDPHAAIRLWSRIGARDLFDFLPSGAHGNSRSRITTISGEIAVMENQSGS